MKKTDIMSGVSKIFNKGSLHLGKHAPAILLAAGIAGTVVSAVMACKATTKIDKILNKTREDTGKIRDYAANESSSEEYTPEDKKKDLVIIYVQTCIKLVKLYAPTAAIGVLSLGLILSSYGILSKRNVALGAAFAAANKGFKEYRNRVAERFGEETDRELKYNIKAKIFEETSIDETGEEKKTEIGVDVAEPDTGSSYARFFDSRSSYWEKDSEYNAMFLRAQERYANDLLKAKGHLFLNEVYDLLDVPRSKAGQIVGWVYNAKKPVGDNYVDFGIFDLNRERTRDFVNGYERAILLDFNVDGNIWDLM